MCLVVMYGVDKSVDTLLFEKMIYMNYDIKPLLNEFTLVGDGLEKYNFYSVGVCNCDSYITRLSESNFTNFHDYYLNQKIEVAKRKKRVDELRNDPKYDKLTAKFKKEFDKKRKEMAKYSVSDAKRMNEYQKWLSKNQVLVDDLLGGITTDSVLRIMNEDIDNIIDKEIMESYDKDTNIIDGALTLADDILIIPIWTDGSKNYKVSVSDIEYKDLNEDILGNMKINTGYRIK